MAYLLIVILIGVLVAFILRMKADNKDFKGKDNDLNFIVTIFFYFVLFHVGLVLVFAFREHLKSFEKTLPLGLAYGPLMYFALGKPSQHSARVSVEKFLMHLIPFVLGAFCFSVFLLSPKLQALYSVSFYDFFYGIVAFSMISYSIVLIFDHKVKIHHEPQKRSFLMRFELFLLLSIGLLLLFFAFMEVNLERNYPGISYFMYGTIIILLALLVIIQIKRLVHRKPPITNIPSLIEEKHIAYQESDEVQELEEVEDEVEDERRALYAKSLISDAIMNRYQKRLTVLINEEKVFRDIDLTLESLAKQIGASNHHLSQLLNIRMKKSFNQYINNLRVEYACKILECGASGITIEELAYECGFNSRVTFNRNFKKFSGMTPTEYRDKIVGG